MKKNIIYICFIILSLSCNNRIKDQQMRITAQLMASQSIHFVQDSAFTIINHADHVLMHLSEINSFVKDIHFIPFYSKYPIGQIDKLIIFDKYVIVLDARKTESIYIFDISGQLLHVIAGKGAGPRDYLGLSDISINRDDSLIVVNDRLALQTLYFSLDGKFVKKTKASPCTYFEFFNNQFINLTSYRQSFSNKFNENFNLTISANDSILYKGFPYYPLQVDAVNHKGLNFNYKGELLYMPDLCDSIYQFVNDSTFTVKYVINQKKSLWNKRYDELSIREYSRLVVGSSYTCPCPPFLETENFIYYQVEVGYNEYIIGTHFFYDKLKKQSYKLGWIIEETTETITVPNVVPYPMTVYGNYYVGLALPHTIEGAVELQKNNKMIFENKEFSDILQNKVTDELEFILAMYELQSMSK